MKDLDLESRAGKGPEDEHPAMGGGATEPDPSDYADPRVAQPGEDPAGEDALRRRRSLPEPRSPDTVAES